jgi:hypothetical protein
MIAGGRAATPPPVVVTSLQTGDGWVPPWPGPNKGNCSRGLVLAVQLYRCGEVIGVLEMTDYFNEGVVSVKSSSLWSNHRSNLPYLHQKSSQWKSTIALCGKAVFKGHDNPNFGHLRGKILLGSIFVQGGCASQGC